MTTIQTLHAAPTPSDAHTEADTPRPPRLHTHQPPHSQIKEEGDSRTPTNASFSASNGKRALPLSPPPPAHATIAKHVVPDVSPEDDNRPVSQRSTRSLDSTEIHGTEQSHTSPENEGSDVESEDDATGRPTKKKKGQRFFCTEYPPCNLSFTRSEHLARHIRKHTGERPFQCHCSRRFSRLDNLRQHAQTVHVNEDIPTDSLAATGTRFQRQIRTDRVRPAGSRPRASTTSSSISHGRSSGHSRNLSTSSIASTMSTMSTMSTISSISQDHRFQPLVMAPDQRSAAGLSIDTQRATHHWNYGQHGSGAPTTPTSTNNGANPGSPYSTITSPNASSRFLPYDRSRHGRRLSVPNASPPYHAGYPMAPSSPSGPGVQYLPSNGPSTVASPTGSTFSTRTELTPSEAELRRRTWHPSTYPGYNYQRPATSGLSYSQTPDAPQPAFASQAVTAASQQPVTLPGFRDLVNTIGRPNTPPNQTSNPHLTQESPSRQPPSNPGSSSDRGVNSVSDRPGHRSWDVTLHQNLNRLDIASGTPPREGGWGQQTLSDLNRVAAAAQVPQTHLQPPPHSHSAQSLPPPSHGQQQRAQLSGPPVQASAGGSSQPMEVEPSSPTRTKRQGWYQGPIAPASQMNMAHQQRISPASSISEGVPTPNNPSFEHHPSIVHANGYVEAPRLQQQPRPPANAEQPAYSVPQQVKAGNQAPLTGLDALVAVATRESQSQEGKP